MLDNVRRYDSMLTSASAELRMKEEVTQPSDHLKGLTDGERTILWQAMTIDILGRALNGAADWINVAFRKEPGGLLRADVSRVNIKTGAETPLMTFGGEPVSQQ